MNLLPVLPKKLGFVVKANNSVGWVEQHSILRQNKTICVGKNVVKMCLSIYNAVKKSVEECDCKNNLFNLLRSSRVYFPPKNK